MSNRFSSVSIVLALGLVFGMLWATPANADNLYASIRGTVTDPTGAVVLGVQVKLTNVETGIVKKITTDSTGGFQFVDLQPGK